VVAVRRPRNVSRSVSPRKAIVGLLATLVSVALLQCGAALADSVTTTFEAPTFTACNPPMPVFAPMCTVNGQGGWKSALPGQIGGNLTLGYDQQVVDNSDIFGFPGHPAPPEFGNQSLRISDAYNPDPGTRPPEFAGQTYSTPNNPQAGQDLPNTEFIGQFSFISVHPDGAQDNPPGGCPPGEVRVTCNRLRISVSPDNGEGGRMSYIELDDVDTTNSETGKPENGIQLVFYDVGPNGPSDFQSYDLGVLPRDVAHTITFWMKLNPGPANDLVRIYIDGKDFGQCFTTWETFYGTSVPVTDSLLFLSGERHGNIPSLIGGGYLFDNVSTKTDNGPGPPGCDVPIDKLPGAPSVTAGGLARYRIVGHNRGRLTERYLMLCDRIPRQMTFVSADRTLSHLGSRRCLFIPRLGPGQSSGFHIVLRVNANAHPGTLDNTADETPVQPPDLPPISTGPPVSTVPPTVPPTSTVPPAVPEVPANIAEIRPIAKARAVVRVLAKARARRPAPPPSPPSFTG
jgi:hypothetical protein